MGSYILLIIALYFSILLLISFFVSKKNKTNEAFFLGNRESPWYIVAIAMIGTSISGVTFVSVPGMVGKFDMTYMQMVFGFFFGYLFISYILLPLYYKLNLTTIYTYLNQRFGKYSYKTGASFFILSKMIGAAARLYLVVLILQTLVFDNWKVPFTVTITVIVVLVWAYTYQSGIKTIIWTDMLQTLCFLTALILIIWQVSKQMDMNAGELIQTIKNSPHSRIFVFDDWVSRQNFLKQFLSGILITIVMTGLDQDMMQKNLTCKNLKEAKKNMISYGFAFTPINFLFLSLGIILLIFSSKNGIILPEKSDQILPLLATEYLGTPVLIFFTVGIIAAAFSSTDSSLTALTTTVCIDIFNIKRDNNIKESNFRKKVHLAICVIFLATIICINQIHQENVLNTIYKAASYTYGPLLGLFFYGLFTKWQIKDKLAPLVCILAPIISYSIELSLHRSFNYEVGYEILLLNGLLTTVGLIIISKKRVD